jgi:hypothetical protein
MNKKYIIIFIILFSTFSSLKTMSPENLHRSIANQAIARYFSSPSPITEECKDHILYALASYPHNTPSTQLNQVACTTVRNCVQDLLKEQLFKSFPLFMSNSLEEYIKIWWQDMERLEKKILEETGGTVLQTYEQSPVLKQPIQVKSYYYPKTVLKQFMGLTIGSSFEECVQNKISSLTHTC